MNRIDMISPSEIRALQNIAKGDGAFIEQLSRLEGMGLVLNGSITERGELVLKYGEHKFQPQRRG